MVSISSTFYEQLLCVKIPKAQIDIDDWTVFFAHLGTLGVKVAHKMLMNFINNLCVCFSYKSALCTFGKAKR